MWTREIGVSGMWSVDCCMWTMWNGRRVYRMWIRLSTLDKVCGLWYTVIKNKYQNGTCYILEWNVVSSK